MAPLGADLTSLYALVYTPFPGVQAAAGANFLLALSAMAEMATALTEHTAAARYTDELDRLRGRFNETFFNGTTGT